MDRRVIWAIVLMMVIAIAPTFIMKPPVRPTAVAADSAARRLGDSSAIRDTGRVLGRDSAFGPIGVVEADGRVTPVTAPAETVLVSSALYEYAISTRGGALLQATLNRYQALDPAGKGKPARIFPEGGAIHQLALNVGNDTVSLADWNFEVLGGSAARRLEVKDGRKTLTLRGQRGGVTVELSYEFRPDDYQIGVRGRATGLGPVGGHLLIGMGHGFRQTEADSAANFYEFGVVTKTDESSLTKFSSLDPGERVTLDGPFEWAAVKAKYFVAALLTVDSGAAQISGATARALPAQKDVTRAEVTFALPVATGGEFDYRLYVGPMEYPRLKAIGHDFYDINPYGWPGFRTMIRPIAVGARWLLVWMHEHLGLAYGMVLVLFGILIRIVLWPLNQKGMRASIRMQGLQPEMQAIQEKYKEDPGRMQKEVMQLYKREGVNPFSGCWPLLLPWPILLALFFVLSNSIELRGQSFLWLPDLSLKDPLYIIPLVMGLSMFGVNKVGMLGMPPSPQAKMMLYFLPVMMTVMFVNFASGLNLYYAVQNIVSIPQQWYLAKERLKAQAANAAAAPPPVPAKAKKSKKE